MNHHQHHARFTVCSPPPLNPHGMSTMQLHTVHFNIPPPHHSHHHHSAPPHAHPHYYRPTQWHPPAYYASRRSSSMSSLTTHRKRKKSLDTSPAHENRLQQEPFSVIRSFKSTVQWISKTFCFCYSDDIIEFNDHYYTKKEMKNQADKKS